ncbi:MAG: hypothetical protein J7L55_00210 [Desulfurococcales archaeon]|nr:hypothetical protein [Desulfurococcales archaeon]
MRASAGAAALLTVLAVTALLTNAHTLTTDTPAEPAIVAQQFLRDSFPELLSIVSTPPKVYGPLKDPITGLLGIKVVWNCSGLYAEVDEVRLNTSWVVKALYVTLNSASSPTIASFVSKFGDRLQSELQSLHLRASSEVRDPYSLVGFQILYNGTPVAYLLPGPYASPARIYWGVRYEGPITALLYVNDFPIIKHFMRGGPPPFTLNSSAACGALAGALKEEIKCAGSEAPAPYYIVVNASLRPAFIKYLNPYERAIVYADDGEVILPGRYSHGEETSRSVPRVSEALRWVSVVAFALAAAVGLLWWFRLRKV